VDQAVSRRDVRSSVFAGPLVFGVATVFAVAALGLMFRDSLAYMVRSWSSEEYSHGYVIPLIAILLVIQKRRELSAVGFGGAWTGVLIALAGLTVGLMGDLSTIYMVAQYGFLIALFGIVFSFVGWRGMRHVWLALVYLAFMVPLPSFLYANLSAEMQLISSTLGVWFIRLMGISVFLSGNIIDLGVYKLQVAEACSGLRYLFPLMSFGFLVAYLYRGPFWHKAILFLSTLPITLVMNSFRVGLIGMAVERWGIASAEGVLHFTQGWVIFMACVAILFAEAWILNRFGGERRPMHRAFRLDFPKPAASLQSAARWTPPKPYLGCVGLVLLAAMGSIAMGERVEAALKRQSLATFPMRIGDWKGREFALDAKILDALDVDDYLMANFRRPQDANRVNFYVAYYASQRAGQAAHSPRSCIPGGGWRIEDLTQRSIDNVIPGRQSLGVNRVVIQKGNVKQLVYYWFRQQGRNLTNEYVIKWYLFWDGVTRNRTDGALIRLVTPMLDGDPIEDADQRLSGFVRAIYSPLIPAYVPQ